jgi:Protein of unknown function (DUF3500)
MKLTRMALAVVALALVAGLGYVAQQGDSSGTNMVAAAQQFLGTLNEEQKGKAVYPFDSPERTNWEFVPVEQKGVPTRKGVRLEEMTIEQRKAALALLRASTSQQGADAATTIMSLEGILLVLENGSGPTRNTGWYFFTVFGTPSTTGNWGWRVEGHHLSLSFTLAGTQVVSTTPNFYGANPADFKSGPKGNVRILAPTETLAIDLFRSLDDDQKKTAWRDKPFGEPKSRSVDSGVGDAVGLPGSAMTAAQKVTLSKLLKAYTDRMAPEVGAFELKRATAPGLDKIYFAFTGAVDAGKGHTYRVQGSNFVIEFLNMQADGAGNQANHIHSVWRHITGDFGKGKG